MPLVEYEKDFSPESLADFRALLEEKNVTLTELPMPQGDNRVMAYRQLSDCLIRKSNILLALWDGDDKRLTGGTSDTLLRFLGDATQGDKIEIVSSIPITPASTEFAYWIPVRRNGAADSDRADVGCRFLSGVPRTSVILAQEDMPSSLQSQLTQLDDYGADFDALEFECQCALQINISRVITGLVDFTFSQLRFQSQLFFTRNLNILLLTLVRL